MWKRNQLISIQFYLYITFNNITLTPHLTEIYYHKIIITFSETHYRLYTPLRSPSFFHFVKDTDPEMCLCTWLGTLVAEPGFQARHKARYIYSMHIWRAADPPGPGRLALSAASWKAVCFGWALRPRQHHCAADWVRWLMALPALASDWEERKRWAKGLGVDPTETPDIFCHTAAPSWGGLLSKTTDGS